MVIFAVTVVAANVPVWSLNRSCCREDVDDGLAAMASLLMEYDYFWLLSTEYCWTYEHSSLPLRGSILDVRSLSRCYVGNSHHPLDQSYL